jgi:hypothetical protein
MSDEKTPAVEGFIRYRKVSGKHRMYCPVREKKVLLGPNQKDADGDVAYLKPGGTPKESNESWERIDDDVAVAGATEQQLQEAAGEPEGTLEIVEVGEEAYDVVNTATGKALNTAPLTRKQAEDIAAGSPVAEVEVQSGKEPYEGAPIGDEVNVCPLEGVKFGVDHDEYEECDDCKYAEACQEASKKVEGEE